MAFPSFKDNYKYNENYFLSFRCSIEYIYCLKAILNFFRGKNLKLH